MTPRCLASPTCECWDSKLSQRQNLGSHVEVVFCEYGGCKSQQAPKKISSDGTPGVKEALS